MNHRKQAGERTPYLKVDSSQIKGALIHSNKQQASLLGTADWKAQLQMTTERAEFSLYWQQIAETAQIAVQEPLPPLTYSVFRQFAETGARKGYEEVYFERRARLAALGIQTAVAADSDEERIYLATLEDALWDVCGEYTWCLTAHLPAEGDPASEVDLFAAETAEMLAELLYMHEDVLDRTVAERIRREVRKRVLDPVFTEKMSFFWRQADHNWSAVCAGGSGMAALLLMDNTDELAAAIEQVCASLESFLSGYGADGGCAEGLGYWVYGFGYYTYFAEMLRERTDGRLDLLAESHPLAIAGFPERIHLSQGVYVNFSDSREKEVLPTGLLHRLLERTGSQVVPYAAVPGLLSDPVRRWAHVLRNGLWTASDTVLNAESSMKVKENTPDLHVSAFDELGWWICRAQRSGADQNEHKHKHEHEHEHKQKSTICGFAIKGGHNGEPHNHNDLGQFILHAGGDNIICDLGAGMYTQAYFQAGRERIINISSGGHNVPIINGFMQGSGSGYRARTIRQSQNELSFEVELDLTGAYPDAGIARYTRCAQWICPPAEDKATMELTDRFVWSCEEKHFEERLISHFKPVIVETGTVYWYGAEAVLQLHYDPEQLEASMYSTDHIDHDGNPFTFYTTCLTHRNVQSAELETYCRLKFEMRAGEHDLQ
ncbi:heparinase II/III family protein [Paenibacillus sp. 453mf]|uniref:heparinase II/III family protein n=1 Tax=Paenibacillus sp. 453mf TaxID=1761874 RepID=UPI0008E1BA3D|nr:heparinase II/III family protein [Paenibacillus sp. 453mf]SFS69781.1 Heparinase II/III-like protein [Paenibacillus sp. 453mf]